MNERLQTLAGNLAYPTAVLVIVLAAWEGASEAGLVAPYILPAPSAILAKVWAFRVLLLHHTWATTVEIVLGFLVALVSGVILAVAVVYVRPFERAFYPWIVATQAIPKVALGPLFIIWFGFGLMPKIVIAALIAFFPIMIGTIVGLKSIERDSLYLLRSMGAGSLQTFWHARLPNGLPQIFAGMKVAIVLASVGAIVGEFVGANEGLGYVLLTANGTVDTQLLFAALLIISVLSTALYWVVHLAESISIRWHVSVRDDVPAATM
jgi:NitT/TauT family transport system permease protein